MTWLCVLAGPARPARTVLRRSFVKRSSSFPKASAPKTLWGLLYVGAILRQGYSIVAWPVCIWAANIATGAVESGVQSRIAPAPLWPSSARISPCWSSSDRPRTATFFPYTCGPKQCWRYLTHVLPHGHPHHHPPHCPAHHSCLTPPEISKPLAPPQPFFPPSLSDLYRLKGVLYISRSGRLRALPHSTPHHHPP